MEGCCPLFDQVEVIVYYIWVGVDDNTPPLIKGLMAHMVFVGRFELTKIGGLEGRTNSLIEPMRGL